MCRRQLFNLVKSPGRQRQKKKEKEKNKTK
jgi:hypothetical protein